MDLLAKFFEVLRGDLNIHLESQLQNREILEMVGNVEKYPEPQVWVPNSFVSTLKLCGFTVLESKDGITKVNFPNKGSWEVSDRGMFRGTYMSWFHLNNKELKYLIGIKQDENDKMVGDYHLLSM